MNIASPAAGITTVADPPIPRRGEPAGSVIRDAISLPRRIDA